MYVCLYDQEKVTSMMMPCMSCQENDVCVCVLFELCGMSIVSGHSPAPLSRTTHRFACRMILCVVG